MNDPDRHLINAMTITHARERKRLEKANSDLHSQLGVVKPLQEQVERLLKERSILADQLNQVYAQVAAWKAEAGRTEKRERERCARICEDSIKWWPNFGNECTMTPTQLADLIRSTPRQEEPKGERP